MQYFLAKEKNILNYQPKPIDTEKVILTAEHLTLTELLAKNTHEGHSSD
jgi:hypothetical protein